MWFAIQSVKDKETDIVISAGNMSIVSCIKIKFKMIDNIDKPALSLYGQIKRMACIRLRCKYECSSKNLLDFSIMCLLIHITLSE